METTSEVLNDASEKLQKSFDALKAQFAGLRTGKANPAMVDQIKVEYYDENLEKKVEEFDNFAARMVQHEFSHLEGVIFTDLVAPIRKKLVTRKLQQISTGKVPTRYKAKIG